MSSTPQVSVVMGVYNEVDTIVKTIESVLSQVDVDLELIVVNDGSDDGTVGVIQSNFNDERLKLIEQENHGLTHALIKGCGHARGIYVARQDAGDYSEPDRLTKQIRFLKDNEACSFVSCTTRFFSAKGEQLYKVDQSHYNPQRYLVDDSGELVGPPHHGSTLFRKQDYLHAGSYRPEFFVAQDIDLWSRLLDLGFHHSLPDALYTATLHPGSLSMTRRTQQKSMEDFVKQCSRARRSQGSDAHVLTKLREQNNTQGEIPKHNTKHQYNYFVGSNLLLNNPQASIPYFRKIVRQSPFHLKAWLKLLTAIPLTLFKRTKPRR